MRIFLLAISFPPCSYSSTTAWLFFALHNGLEPSSDSRTWSMAVTSPASEQSVTSSPLQTSSALYSKTQKNAIPFLKFFSIFLNFLLRRPFLPHGQKIKHYQGFSKVLISICQALCLSTPPGVSFNNSMHTFPCVSHFSKCTNSPFYTSDMPCFSSNCTITHFRI